MDNLWDRNDIEKLRAAKNLALERSLGYLSFGKMNKEHFTVDYNELIKFLFTYAQFRLRQISKEKGMPDTPFLARTFS